MWLIKKILKLDSPITVIDWFYQRITGNWAWIVATCGGFGMSYLAKITEWLQPWRPVGWAGIGLFFAIFIGLTVSVIYFLYAAAFARFSMGKLF